MNRTIILLIVFLVLAGFTGWYFYGGTPDKTSLLKAERTFKVDPEDIGKIFIADREGTQTTLERRKDHWVVNGQYRAYDNAVDNLLDAISRIEMDFKPPEAMVPNMVKSLATNGLKVEIYDRRERQIMAYYLGGTTQDETGTFIIREGFDQPYVAHIPGWTGNLRYRYNLRGDEWRDKSVFRADISDIAEVGVEYPQQKNQSFRILRQDGDWKVLPFYEITPTINRLEQEGAVETYLTEFEGIFAETFQNDNPQRDSLREQLPFCTIQLKTRDGNVQQADFYPRYPKIPINPETGVPIPSGDVVERYSVLSSSGDFMVVQQAIFQKLFRPYGFFFK
ncbi:MAG: DUF4340 domain-containing protein [Saprospiraceae bacterium]|nr:DUF4340 domain-containing protein [Lewinella sp.]